MFRSLSNMTGGELLCKFKHFSLERMGCRFAQSSMLQRPVLYYWHLCTSSSFYLPLLFSFCGFLGVFLTLTTEWWLGSTATMLYDLQTSPLLFCCFSLYGFPQLPPPTQSSPAAVCWGLLREIMMSANCSISVLCPHCLGGKATLLK